MFCLTGDVESDRCIISYYSKSNNTFDRTEISQKAYPIVDSAFVFSERFELKCDSFFVWKSRRSDDLLGNFFTVFEDVI